MTREAKIKAINAANDLKGRIAAIDRVIDIRLFVCHDFRRKRQQIVHARRFGGIARTARRLDPAVSAHGVPH